MTLKARLFKERAAIVFCSLAAIIAVGMLFLIIGDIFFGAMPSLSLNFLLTPENRTGLGQGIANAVVGTILLSLFATILATPLGITTAIYMKRYAPDSRLTHFIRFMIEVLSGTPSIVVGMFGLLVLVIYLKPYTGGFSLVAGMIALAILIMPVIERAVESAIDTVNRDLEEGSYALGATKWQTIRMTTIPAAMNGVLTSIILGFGRAAEESSVVIVTAGYSQWLPALGIAHNSKFFSGFEISPFNDVTASLPVAVYNAYENTNVIPMSNAYAIALILIAFVLIINISAKVVCSGAISAAQGGERSTFILFCRSVFDPFKKKEPAGVVTGRFEESSENPCAPVTLYYNGENAIGERAENSEQQATGGTISAPNAQKSENMIAGWIQSLRARLAFTTKKAAVLPAVAGTGITDDNRSLETVLIPQRSPVRLRPLLRAFIPFAIPAAILLLISFLAGIPPLHNALGPASASLAGLFASGLSLIVTVSGLVFAFFVARKGGAFQARNRRAGFAGVGAGFCVLCIAGIVASSAAAGLFITGNTTAQPQPAGTDRSAQLAAMLASGQLGGDSGAPAGNPTVVPSPAATSTPSPYTANPHSLVPVKDALSLHEFYTYGSAPRTVRATVTGVQVLPYYFWWWIDYNRFVQSVPAQGDEYLVVYLRTENTGEKSALIPSADQYNLTYNGVSYGHLPYLNTSVFSDWQLNYYSANYDKLPYQWIREIGQDKRDYAFQTQYIGLDWNSTTTDQNGAIIPDQANGTTTNATSLDTTYAGYFLQPGSSNAIDGYLIYEVPEAVTKDLSHAYVQVSFNQQSWTRWNLG